MRIRRARPDEAGLLFDIWRAAVEATHHFLAAADLELIAAMVRDEYLPSAALWVATDDQDRPLAFMGMTGDMLDTLFVVRPPSLSTDGSVSGCWGGPSGTAPACPIPCCISSKADAAALRCGEK
jgi:hypothetical protein